jgi:hypothetical protein
VLIEALNAEGLQAWIDDGSGVNTGQCPDGFVLIYDDSGNPACLPYIQPIPSSGPTSAPSSPSPQSPAPAPAASPIAPRQPGAAAAPYNPPGRVGLWPGPFPGTSSSALPTTTTTTASDTQTSIVGGATAIATASINQNITVMNQDVQPLADAVNAGITTAVDQAQTVANQTTSQITGALGTFSNSLFDWVKSIGTWLKDNIVGILESIGNGVLKVANAVYQAIGGALSQIADFYHNTLAPILTSIATAVKDVVAFYQQHIQPILAAVGDAINTISKVVTAIQADIKAGLEGILRIPTDLANAFAGLESIFQRTVNALKAKDLDVWSTVGGYDATHQMTGDMLNIHRAIAGMSGLVKGAIPSFSAVTVDEPELATSIAPILEAMNTIFVQVLSGVMDLIHKPGLLAEVGAGVAAGLVAELFEPLEILFFIWEIMKAPLELFGELAAETVRAKVPLTKLDPATVISAWQRGIMDAVALDEELKVQGWSAARQRIMQDLAEYFPGVEETLDKWHRGIIAEADVDQLLKEHGMTPDEGTAQKEQSFKIDSPGTFALAFQYGELTVDDIQAVMKENRFSDAEKVATLATLFRPPNHTEEHARFIREALFGAFGFDQTQFTTVPPYWLNGARTAGMSEATATDIWKGTFDFLDLQTWITLFQRGYATPIQIGDIMSSLHIPKELQSSVIDAARPLIPFRTIPAMIAAGIVSESDAIRRIEQHGFSSDDAVLLVQYATRGKKTAAASTAVAQHGLSLQQARSAYDDGIITVDQYTTLLQAHGLDPQAVTLEVKLAQTSQEAKARKQIGIDIVNEYQAGVINQQQAIQQLSTSGYTVAEQAAVQRKLKTANAAKAKTPSEPEIRAMATKDVITTDDYYQTLITIGYSTTWAQRFRDLHFPSAPAVTAPSPVGG